jgi:hypothetical protein
LVVFSDMLGRVLLCFGIGLASQVTAAEWHVAPGGDDAALGTKARPFATLEKARDVVRGSGKLGKEPVTVWLGAGVYRLDKTFELGMMDLGAAKAPVVYRATEGAEVRVIGGREVTDWKPVTDALLLARIEPLARVAVRVADLKAMGISDFGTMRPRGFGQGGNAALELFFDGRPMALAQWPNEGWAEIGKLPDGKDGMRFGIEDDRIKRWATAADPWVFGYWYHNWADQHLPLASVDVAKRELVLKKKHGYGMRTGRRFRVENLLEELDAPGEWYLDRSSGRLYFWPPAAPSGTTPVVSLMEDPLVQMQGASHITVQGVVFEACRGTAVLIRGGASCQVLDCRIRNTGGLGVGVTSGTGHRIARCEVTENGAGAVSVSGGDRKTLRPAGHEVVDCDLHAFARTVRTYQPGVRVNGVGIRVAHNHIHHAPHSAVLFSGNDHRIEFNEVDHVCQETDDAGAFYIGRNWTTRGHLILHNHFHDIGTKLGAHGTHHVYLDDCASGVTIRGNFFEGGYRAMFIGGGRDNVVEGNLFVDSDPAVWVDNRGLGWAAKNIAPGGPWGIHKRLHEMNHDQPPFSTRYPGLANILNEDPHAPRGNRITNNVMAGGVPFETNLKDKTALTMEDNWTGPDPGFVDRGKRDFRLEADSPAQKTGYKDLPFGKMGIQEKSTMRSHE